MSDPAQQNPPQDDDILVNLATEIARLQAIARDSEAKAQQLEAAANMIRTARGTSEVTPHARAQAMGAEPHQVAAAGAAYAQPVAERRAQPSPPITLPPSVERRTQPRSRAQSARAITPGGLVDQIRATLTERSVRLLDLAATVGVAPETLQSALDDLHREGHVYRFQDGAYTWKVHNPPAHILNSLIKRYMIERQVSRAELRGAIPHDGEVGKYQGKRIDNHLDIVRSHEPVWAQKDDRGNMLYWIVPGQTPPKEMDGRKVLRVRASTAVAQKATARGKKTSQVSRRKP